jgi:hypothetical protein
VFEEFRRAQIALKEKEQNDKLALQQKMASLEVKTY